MDYVIDDLLERDIIISAKVDIQNDSFSHAFGTEYYADHIEVEELTYDKSLFSEDEQSLIDEYLSDNHDIICRSIQELWEQAQADKEFFWDNLKDEY